MKHLKLKNASLAKLHLIRSHYLNQKYSSARRGIEFLFTMQEWADWWEAELGPDWLRKRGPYAHQYCMARKGDKGPYVSWNVDCITNSKNTSLVKKRKGTMLLTTADCEYILRNRGVLYTYVLAAKFNVSMALIHNVWVGKTFGRKPI